MAEMRMVTTLAGYHEVLGEGPWIASIGSTTPSQTEQSTPCWFQSLKGSLSTMPDHSVHNGGISAFTIPRSTHLTLGSSTLGALGEREDIDRAESAAGAKAGANRAFSTAFALSLVARSERGNRGRLRAAGSVLGGRRPLF